MYDDLVKSLRICGDSVDAIDECCFEECIQHERPIDPMCMQALCNKAADAIEEIATNYDAATDIMKHQTEYIEELEANKPRWIPVTERCPEKSGDYLVFDCCGNLYVNEWHCLLKKWQYDDSRITHWMPLPPAPEPPKEEKNND